MWGEGLEDRSCPVDLFGRDPHLHHALAAQQLADGPLAHEPAVGDDPDHVRHLLDLAQVVARHEDGLAGRGEETEGVAHGHDAGRVEAVGRLVEEEELRVAEQRRGDPQPLLHAERIGGHRVPRAVAQADQVEQLLDPLVGGPRAGCGQRTQVFAAAQVRIEGRRFDESTDLEQPPPIASPERPAQHLDRSRVGSDEAGQQPHRGGLAGAIGSEEPVDHAGRHRQVEPVEGEALAVALAQAPRGEGEAVGVRRGNRHAATVHGRQYRRPPGLRAPKPSFTHPVHFAGGPAIPTVNGRRAASQPPPTLATTPGHAHPTAACLTNIHPTNK